MSYKYKYLVINTNRISLKNSTVCYFFDLFEKCVPTCGASVCK